MDKVTTASEEFRDKEKLFDSQLQAAKMLSGHFPPAQKMINVATHMFENVRRYIDMKLALLQE